MILIADSGSTKTQWSIVTDTNAAEQSIVTSGINAAMLSSAEIADILRQELMPRLDHQRPYAVRFYGAGCIDDATCAGVARAISDTTGCTDVEVASDLLAAARALCGKQPGIACILGTGSNSCLYDGHKIVANVSPLGFILGDEGSGAVLGRTLVADVLKHQLPADLCQAFHKRYPIAYPEIIASVYRRNMPSRFLASFVPFLADNINRTEISRLVENAFKAFFRRNVDSYTDAHSLPLHFTGSVAYYFEPQLRQAAADSGYSITSIVKSPRKGLLKFHSHG